MATYFWLVYEVSLGSVTGGYELKSIINIGAIVGLLLNPGLSVIADTHKSKIGYDDYSSSYRQGIQLGPRPFSLVRDMDPGQLKRKLQSCNNGPFYKTDFSIGHRGAAMLFPEHTRESYTAAAKMGAGIVECDVTFTSDRALVCRHSQCDLHTTTNILATDLASKCSEPFTPATYDADGKLLTKASAKCCTSDITVEEFKTLTGKMDAADSGAINVEDYLKGKPTWRSGLYTGSGTLMTHKESIRLFKKLNVKMTPELKSPSVVMPYQGDYTQQDYAQQMIDEYKQMGVPASKVWPQSFNIDDIRYWIDNEPRFGMQAVFLDGRFSDSAFDHKDPSTWQPSMEDLVADGARIIAPPMWMLVEINRHGKIVPSAYAKRARDAGLDIIAWTLERSDLRKGATKDSWYHQTTFDAINKPGDRYKTLDVLAKGIGIIGIFTDWPATVTYYANCMSLD